MKLRTAILYFAAVAAPLLVAAQGAKIVEKHFIFKTISSNESEIICNAGMHVDGVAQRSARTIHVICKAN